MRPGPKAQEPQGALAFVRQADLYTALAHRGSSALALSLWALPLLLLLAFRSSGAKKSAPHTQVLARRADFYGTLLESAGYGPR